MDILSEARALQDTLTAWRRTLHKNAEVGTDLPKTAAFVESVLTDLSVAHCRLTENGIVGWMGQGSRTILLRADMDALPGTERSGLAFACRTGAVHACGHDMHTAMLLGAASLLQKRCRELPGRVVLMFQPGEECMTGAKAMVDAGLLERFSPDCALAMHVNVQDVPDGQVWIKQGAFMAASDSFEIEVTGKRGHGAHPHTAVNPIYAAVQIIQALTDMTRYEISPITPAILTVCAVQAGDAANVIPETCLFRGTVRTLDVGVRDRILERAADVAQQVAKAYRCAARFCLLASTPATVNDAGFSAWARRRLEELLGLERVQAPSMSSMGSEDFSQISSRIPSCYMSIGIPRAPGCQAPLHSEHIVFDEKNLYLGAAVFASLALDYLNDTYVPTRSALGDIKKEETT